VSQNRWPQLESTNILPFSPPGCLQQQLQFIQSISIRDYYDFSTVVYVIIMTQERLSLPISYRMDNGMVIIIYLSLI